MDQYYLPYIIELKHLEVDLSAMSFMGCQQLMTIKSTKSSTIASTN